MGDWGYMFLSKYPNMANIKHGLMTVFNLQERDIFCTKNLEETIDEAPKEAFFWCVVRDCEGDFSVTLWFLVVNHITDFPKKLTYDAAIAFCHYWECDILTRFEGIEPSDPFQWHFVNSKGLVQVIDLDSKKLDYEEQVVIGYWLDVVRHPTESA